MKVYLAGPMSGVALNRADNWRQTAIRYLHDQGNTWFNPVDSVKAYLATEEKIVEGYSLIGLRPRDTFVTDIYHLRDSNVVLANLKEWNDKSFGTAFEFGVAWSFGIPIVCVAGNKGANPFVSESCIIVEDMEEALMMLGNFN